MIFRRAHLPRSSITTVSLRSIVVACLLLALAAGCDVSPSSNGTTSDHAPATVVPPPLAFDLEAADDFAAAAERARREGKPLLILFETSWCPYCKQLRDEVFTRAEFRSAAERFVCVRVDGNRDDKRCREYGVRAFPTLVPASFDGTALERIVGVPTVEGLVSRLNTAATTIVAARPETPVESTRR